MENENVNPGGSAQESSGHVEVEAKEQSAKEKQDVVKYETFKKVLNEKKSLDERLRQLEQKLAEERERKLIAEGREKEALEEKSKIISDLEKRISEKERLFKERLITEQIKREAQLQGCLDADVLIKIADFSGIEVDEEFNLKSGVKEAIEKIKQQKPFLFKSETKPIKDAAIGAGAKGFEPKSIKQMTKEELIEAIKKASLRK